MSEVHSPGDKASPNESGPDLGALIASRICHDLVSPLGAIGNGLELLALTGLGGSPEMDLIAESVQNATARVRFFRVAFGSAAPGQSIGAAEAAGTLAALARGGRTGYDWRAEGEQPRAEVRAAFLLLQCLESAMPMGGRVTVSREGADWVVAAASPRLRLDQALWDALEASRAPPTEQAALVQFALLPLALAGLGRTLRLAMGADRIVARF